MLVLRGSLTPRRGAQYAEVAGGNILSREDAWQRAVEFLFERLVVRWEIAGHRADHPPEGAAGALPLRLAGGAALDPRDAARAPGRALPGHGGPMNVDGFARLLTDYCLEVQPGPAGARRVDDARRAAAAGAAARDPRARGLAAAARRAARARTRASGAPRATRTSTPSRPPSWPRRARSTPRCGSRPPTTRTRWPAWTRRGWPARRARAGAAARAACWPRRWAITLWPTPAAAQQAGMGTRRASRPSSTRALFLDRDDPAAAWGELREFQAGLIERLAPAQRDPHRRPRAPT